jgi:hypothetical protein
MTIITIVVTLSVLALILNLWVLFQRDSSSPYQHGFWSKDWKKEAAFYALWEFLRVKMLSGGYGKHYAFYVNRDGTLLSVDAVYFYLAHLTGINDFWDLVSDAVGSNGSAFTGSIEEIDLGDGKRDFTYVDNGSIRAFVDGVVPSSIIDADYCTRVTAKDFSDAVINAQAEACERNRGRYLNVFHVDDNY